MFFGLEWMEERSKIKKKTGSNAILAELTSSKLILKPFFQRWKKKRARKSSEASKVRHAHFEVLGFALGATTTLFLQNQSNRHDEVREPQIE
jgi:hypothetical protein